MRALTTPWYAKKCGMQKSVVGSTHFFAYMFDAMRLARPLPTDPGINCIADPSTQVNILSRQHLHSDSALYTAFINKYASRHNTNKKVSTLLKHPLRPFDRYLSVSFTFIVITKGWVGSQRIQITECHTQNYGCPF